MSASSTVGHSGVFGASGSGKSTYAKRLIKSRKRIIVFDPLDEYGAIGFNRLRSVDAVRLAVIASPDKFKLAYVPRAGREATTLSMVCDLLLRLQSNFKAGLTKQIVTLVVEEMNLCFHVHGGDAKSPRFAEICSRGRHFGIEVIGISQRIAEVNTRFRGNLTRAILLRQQGPNDKRAAADVAGVSINEIGRLKNLDYLEINSDGEKKLGNIKF